MKRLQAWINEWSVLLMALGFGLMFVGFFISMIMMPVEFRNGVMPEVWRIRGDIPTVEYLDNRYQLKPEQKECKKYCKR